MKHYKSDNLKTQLSQEQIDFAVETAIAVQDAQKALDRISVPKIARNLAGMTKQGLHLRMAAKRGEAK